MKLLLLINLLAVVVATAAANDVLMWHSYAFYGLQLVTMLPYLLARARYVQNLFLPTFFVLAYFLVNLTFGSYLVPRDYGWDKQFSTAVLQIEHYNLIVPFLLMANVVLFVLTHRTLSRINELPQTKVSCAAPGCGGMAKTLLYFALFFAVSYADPYNVFSFQLALLILHLSEPSLRRRWHRYPAYAFYLLVMVGFSYENKREIAIALFLMVFLEAHRNRSRLRFTIGSIAAYAGTALGFLLLILAASILRGYGDFAVGSVFQALSFVPQYVSSDMFIDGVTDNLELNYNYGVAVTAIDHGIRGLVEYQYGGSLVKLLFLPIPRDLIAFKPESMMQLFTQVYAPQWWAEEGSMPVMFAADMFLNFHVLGLLPYALVWMGINHLFVTLHRVRPRSLLWCSCVFLCISVLMLARGSGIELWFLYFVLAAPVFVAFRLFGNSLRIGEPTRRWVV